MQVVCVHATDADAQDEARRLIEDKRAHYFVKQVNLAWRERERARYQSGEYKSCVWHMESWYHNKGLRDHFVHASQKKPGLIAYTESPEKGEQDRQTSLKPGVYLTRYFSDVLSEREIAHWSRLQTNAGVLIDCELKLARTPDEIEHVYITGPASCMSDERFESDEHPVRVYGDSDLCVAYIESPADYHDENIAARALVWPERKTYGRIYPTPDRYESGAPRLSAIQWQDSLMQKLEAEGYKRGSFNGARIRAIRDRDDSYVMPYIDGGYNVNLDGAEFVLAKDGDYSPTNTNGLLELSDKTECENCGERTDSDDLYNVHMNRYSSQQWCEHCYSSETFYCHGTEESYSTNCDYVIGADGETYAQHYADRHMMQCDETGDWYDNDETYPVMTSKGEKQWCESARDDWTFHCHGTDNYYDSREYDSVEIDGETYEREYALADLIMAQKIRAMEETTETMEG